MFIYSKAQYISLQFAAHHSDYLVIYLVIYLHILRVDNGWVKPYKAPYRGTIECGNKDLKGRGARTQRNELPGPSYETTYTTFTRKQARKSWVRVTTTSSLLSGEGARE